MSNQLADAVFDALGEPVRRRTIESLADGPKPVGKMAALQVEVRLWNVIFHALPRFGGPQGA